MCTVCLDCVVKCISVERLGIEKKGVIAKNHCLFERITIQGELLCAISGKYLWRLKW